MRWPWEKRPQEVPAVDEIRIGESIHVHYRYHLYRHGRSWQALCGAEVMDRNLTDLSLWGFKGHLNERYCSRCGDHGKALGLSLGGKKS